VWGDDGIVALPVSGVVGAAIGAWLLGGPAGERAVTQLQGHRRHR
jgi:hypothetical protein